MIYVITHKEIDDAFINDKLYTVLHVGKNDSCKSSYLRDDTGDNISEKNSSFCELTGLYWIWKNGTEKPSDLVGLVHYRRFFTTYLQERLYAFCGIQPNILKAETIKKYCNAASVILPQKEWMGESVFKQYEQYHHREDLLLARKIIHKDYPEYMDSFNTVMNEYSAYHYNMFICQKKIMDKYCEWLFDILFQLEKEIDPGKYEDAYQRRVFGFLGERLLQVWFTHHNYRIKEFPVFNTEERSRKNIRLSIKKVIYSHNHKG